MSAGRLVLVLCTERSGSTLLSVMLGAHPRVVAPPELHFLRYSTVADWRVGSPKAKASLAWLREELSLPEPPENSTPVPLYRDFLAAVGPERMLVDKSPAYARDPEALARAEELAPFYIWLVRHPLGVAASRIERLHKTHREHDGSVGGRLYSLAWRARDKVDARTGRDARRQVAFWTRVHNAIASFLAGVPAARQHRVHFETLVQKPTKTLEALCAALALTVEPAMLAPTAHAPKTLGWGVGDEKIRSHKKIDPAVATRWKERYDPRLLPSETQALMAGIGVRPV